MSLQRTSGRAGKVTLAAFVWFFFAVSFQMSPQMACIWGYIITLIAFIWLFSTVYFQMFPQMACMRRSIFTLVAFVWPNDFINLFLHHFHICLLQTQVMIVKIVFHYHCFVLCFAQSISSNWGKFMIPTQILKMFPRHTFTFSQFIDRW